MKERFYQTSISGAFFFAISSLLIMGVSHSEVSDVVEQIDVAQIKAEEKIEALAPAATMTREAVATKKERGWKPLYITVLGGQDRFAYKDRYIESKYATGVALGVNLFSGLSMEGEFQYAHFELPKGLTGAEITTYRDSRTGWILGQTTQVVHYNIASQYRGSGNLKYRIFNDGLISPFISAGASVLKSQAKMTNGLMNQGARESQMQTALAGQIGGGVEVNLGQSIRVGAGVKLFKHLADLNKPSKAWKPLRTQIAQEYLKRNPHPADLGNQKEFFEVMGTLSFDL